MQILQNLSTILKLLQSLFTLYIATFKKNDCVA